MFQIVKAVKIFDHLCFLIFVKHENVAIGEFIRIVFDSLINLFGLDSVQVCDITIKEKS